MRLFKSLLLCAVIGLPLSSLSAQSDTDTHPVTIIIGSIAAVAVTGGNITLTIIAPGVGGQAPSNPSDSSCYLQYTSLVSSGQSRTLTAGWGGLDAAPSGCSLKIQATPSGGGGEGSGAGQKTVSSTAQIVISGISTCATGTGVTDGANLTYTLSIDTYTSLVGGESKLATLTFTLTDAS